MASQYYAQIGIGNVARPMVVGDRLWLFSQSPPNSTAPRSILNNSNNSPIVTNRFHNFDNSQVVSMSNSTAAMQPVQMPVFTNYLPPCNFLPSSSAENVPNIGANYRTDALYSEYLSSQQSKHITMPSNNFHKDYRSFNSSYTATNAPKTLLNKLFWSNGFANRPVDNNGFERLSFQSDGFASGYVGSAAMAAAAAAAAAAAVATPPDTNLSTVHSGYTKETNGIAELERVFGLSDKCKQSFNNSKAKGDKINEVKSNGIAGGDCNDCYSETSDVDCERL